MANITQPLKIIFSKIAIQTKIIMWKIKYVSADMIKH
jgi:hypothetical protein